MKEKLKYTFIILGGIYVFMYYMFVIAAARYDIMDWTDAFRIFFSVSITAVTLFTFMIRHAEL